MGAGWTRALAKGSSYVDYGISDLGEAATNAMFASSPSRIFRRLCAYCQPPHNVIFYKRQSAMPDSFSIYRNMAATWASEGNVLGVDFNLYGSYEDTLAGTNAWQYCNYDVAAIGFPRECGPLGRSASQWNAFGQTGGETDVAFDINISPGECNKWHALLL